MRRPDDITVTVEQSGRILVNGHLVAEVAAGKVDTRDDLARNIDLHRIADRIVDRIAEAVDTLADHDDLDLARGFVDGLRGLTQDHPSPGVPQIPGTEMPLSRAYLDGWKGGHTIRVLSDLLDRARGDGR